MTIPARPTVRVARPRRRRAASRPRQRALPSRAVAPRRGGACERRRLRAVGGGASSRSRGRHSDAEVAAAAAAAIARARGRGHGGGRRRLEHPRAPRAAGRVAACRPSCSSSCWPGIRRRRRPTLAWGERCVRERQRRAAAGPRAAARGSRAALRLAGADAPAGRAGRPGGHPPGGVAGRGALPARAAAGPGRASWPRAASGTSPSTPPRQSPVRYCDSLGVLHARLVAAHGVQVDAADRELLAERGVHVVLCPRSNRSLGVGHGRRAGAPRGGRAPGARHATASRAARRWTCSRTRVLLQRQFPALDPARRSCAWRRSAAPRPWASPTWGRSRPGRRAALAYAAGRRRRRRDPDGFLLSGEARLERVAAGVAAPAMTSLLERARAYGRMIRFSHSVFALPFALDLGGARRAGGRGDRRPASSGSWWRWSRRAARRWASTAWSTRRSTRGTRARPAASCRGASLSRGEAWLFVALSVGRLRAGRGDAEPALPRALAGGARDRARLLVHQALHRGLPPGARAGARRGPGRRLARDPRPLRRRARRARRWPCCCGWPASTRSTPARTSSSTAQEGLRSLPARLGVPRALWLARAHARRARSLLLLALFGLAPLHPVYLAGRRGRGGAPGLGALARRGPHDLSRVMQAFNLNGWVSLGYFA